MSKDKTPKKTPKESAPKGAGYCLAKCPTHAGGQCLLDKGHDGQHNCSAQNHPFIVPKKP
jgi:hypothetical protein